LDACEKKNFEKNRISIDEGGKAVGICSKSSG
jgi:hypothetical protein